MAKEHGYVAEKNVDKFHSVWMGIIGSIGRMYEPGLIVGRNVSTGKLFQDTSCFQTVLPWQFHKQKCQQSQSCHEDRDKSRTPSKNMSDGGSDRHTDDRSDTEA